MSAQKLTAFEQKIVGGLAYKSGLAASLFDAWANLPESSVQSERSLIALAQLGVTEESAAKEILAKAEELGLLDAISTGYRPRVGTHLRFRRIAFALNAIEYYMATIHQDATASRVVLTRPPRPSTLERRLSDLGWRTSELEPTDHAFHSIVRAAQQSVVVMTPFFDKKGALWLQELLSYVQVGVDRVLILRSLEDPARRDYPHGYDIIAAWLKAEGVRVFNYSIPRLDGKGRETFHAKVVLCDRSSAYLGSSNLTAASLEHSMEMGIALQGRTAVDVAVVLDAVLAASTPWQ